MHLNDCLRELALFGNLNPDELIGYATEDSIGGRDTLKGRIAPHGSMTDFSGMSVFADEGRILYALVRAMKPEMVVEIGVDAGCSSFHILAALETNGKGHLYSVDIKTEVGQEVPDNLKHRWTLVTGQDSTTAPLPGYVDLCFEDGAHDYHTARATLERLKALSPRVVMSHDAVTHRVYGDAGFQTHLAFHDVFGVDNHIVPDRSIAGLLYWFNNEKPEQA